MSVSLSLFLSLMPAESKGKDKAMKTDLLRARNMKRYINQLTVAKKQCEKRIWLLGGPNYEQQEDGANEGAEGAQTPRVRGAEGAQTPRVRGWPVWELHSHLSTETAVSGGRAQERV